MKADDPGSPNPELARLIGKLERKRADGRGIRFSAVDMDWLVLTGAYRAVVLAAEEEAYAAVKQRALERGADPALIERLEVRRYTRADRKGPPRKALSSEE